MPSKDAHLCKVHFLPNDLTVEVAAGTTILDAARKAGAYINSICGGDGICGKCKVILDKGRADTPPTTLLRREEIQRNYLLACESRVLSDLQILIPEESRLEGGKILLDEDAQRFGTLAAEGDESQFKLDPLVKKVFLDLHSPSVDENLADKEQVFYAIHTKVGVPLDQMQMGYRILRQLPKTLREGQWQVTATVAHRGSTAEVVEIEKGDRSRYNLGVAVDVGTTTVVSHLIDLGTGKTIGAEATYNAQMKYGEDYIQRIMYATENDALDVMQKSITDDLNSLISKLVRENHVNLSDVTSVVCSGNTAMMHFLLGLDPSRIRREPYVPTANFIPAIRAAEAGITISGRGLLYCLPSVAAYVGSDITAGAVAIRLDKAEEMSLFIDIGTNGEVVLGHKDWMVCCSASAGPAFEGSGVRHGMRAAGGAIEKLTITKDLDVEYKTIGDKRARGVCGSGLLDCIAWLFRRGIIDRAGKFQRDVKTNRLRQTDEGLEFVLVKRADAGIDSDIVITQADIANLIRSKAAIYAAASILIESMHVPMDSIQKVHMAGGFGNYLDIQSAITIGMLPDIPLERIKFVGNTAVAGAKMALLSREAFETVSDVAGKMTYFDLMGNSRYMEEFVQANFLPHTNIEEFPMVKRLLAGG